MSTNPWVTFARAAGPFPAAGHRRIIACVGRATVIYAVALRIAGALSWGGLDEIEAACGGVGADRIRGEIDEAGIVCRRALG